jgi:uncharacterized protein (DUF1684 family)
VPGETNGPRYVGHVDSIDPLDKLLLADWRRRTAELYADVRDLAVGNPATAWNLWRLVRERMYREHPASPVPADRGPTFVARHFDYDPGLRFELQLLPDEPAADAGGAHESEAEGTPGVPGAGSLGGSSGRSDRSATVAQAASTAGTRLGIGLALPISVGDQISFDRLGWLEVPFASGVRRLAVYWLPEYSGGLFLPFRDATNGAETYGGGRYLIDSAKGADLGGDPASGTVIVDFNFAYQPSCAFDPRWSCPLSPPENRLDLEIRAGEMIR